METIKKNSLGLCLTCLGMLGACSYDESPDPTSSKQEKNDLYFSSEQESSSILSEPISTGTGGELLTIQCEEPAYTS